MEVKVSPAAAERYRQQGWWPDQSVGEMVRERAARHPDALAYADDNRELTWSEYDQAADGLAVKLAGLGLERGDRVAVYLPDSALLHVAYIACERAGLVTVGIPERAGNREFDHLLGKTQAKLLVSEPEFRGTALADLIAGVRGRGVALGQHAELAADGTLTGYSWTPDGPVRTPDCTEAVDGRQLGPDDLWLLNSTSGTTGLPKCVEQVQHKWAYLARLAVKAAELSAGDVIMSVVPGPFGYGLWTAHFLPAMLGAPCVLSRRFSAESTLRAAAQYRVTVLACVNTQLNMMLASPALAEADLSSLRILYTGGERLPPQARHHGQRRAGPARRSRPGRHRRVLGRRGCQRRAVQPGRIRVAAGHRHRR